MTSDSTGDNSSVRASGALWSHIALPSSTKPLGILLAVVTSSCHALLPASPNAAVRPLPSISSWLYHSTDVDGHAGLAHAIRSRCYDITHVAYRYHTLNYSYTDLMCHDTT